jgi:hypothetical protein
MLKKMKRKISLIIFILVAYNLYSYSQGEISDQENIVFRNEKSFGVSANTNGWSIDYKTGKYINIHKSQIFLYSLNIIKHPQEIKQTNLYLSATNRFVYGKLNSCFDLRFGYGLQQQIFKKEDVGSIEIRISGTVGPIIGFLKPIYYNINDSTERTEKYLPSHQPATIAGKASFFKGIPEIKANPGVFINVGIGFEHGKKQTQLRSIDVGFLVYAYLLEMEIMANDQNTHFFVSLYASYRIGKFSYGRHLSKLNEEEDIF